MSEQQSVALTRERQGDQPQMEPKEVMRSIVGVLAAFFAAMLATTIVSIALPTIMDALNGTQTDFNWVLTAALLANAATTPIWGKLADLFDKKKLLQLGILTFVAGSLLAGFAINIPMLMSARVIQGIGMGGLTAMGMAVIGTVIPPRERGRYSGYFGGVMALATAGGPLLGGLIVDSPLGWRWTFFIGVPIALISMWMIHKTLHIKHVARKVYIDWAGAVLVTVSVSVLLIWVSYVGKAGYFEFNSWQTYAMVGGSLALIALLIWVEGRVPEPVIPLRIIAMRTTALSIIASVSIGVAMFGSGAFLGQYFQVAREASPTMAGVMTLPMILGNLFGSVFSGQMISRHGRWKIFLVVGASVNIAALALLGTMSHDTNYWILAAGMFFNGVGMGFMVQNLVLAVQNTVKVTDIGTASSSVAFFRSVGGAAGVAVLGAMLSDKVSALVIDALTAAHLISPDGSGGVASGSTSLDLSTMPAAVRVMYETAFGDATGVIFMASAAVAVVSLVCVLLIKEAPLRRTV
ncbi:MFS transporter [Paeniglutamicibacter kerguelensis]|uniref:EmrB/QacA subfamily drug resistance transporter n=1 Tax=Paeniglutamicibacter kerguelensis TaxID=254788 RepID=A0ABS4X8W9_9MICC|nr:EmrB/QacA subfamily drug resistance transporter [Paeniglutamicibacter kerguelensis]